MSIGKPAFQFNLDEYTGFETIDDLFIEFIRMAAIKRKNGKRGLYVLNDNFNSEKVLVTIDGIPILDHDYILNFDPLKIEKIGIVNDIYYMGGLRHFGIMNFTTYKGDFAGEELPEYVIEKAYQGLQSPREFYSPDYGIPMELLKRIPDYRNTLYWNPEIRPDSDGNIEMEFYTSDDTGSYQIDLNGITKNGQAAYLRTSFDVQGIK